ncbi:MAG: 50S ribosomal protein L15 [Candidatus Omnitrophica bacterium]|nr:50S ribosomal protein L15 [Candidatus Omnitrophota bacterium]
MDLSKVDFSLAHKRRKRVGRGPGSGHGKTSGRGHKGTGQRKGRKYYVGFWGGNVPYLRKIPKRGFNSPRAIDYQVVNLKDIEERLKGRKYITPVELEEVRLIRDKDKPVKILGEINGKLTWQATFKANKFSASAKRIIEESGGKIEC